MKKSAPQAGGRLERVCAPSLYQTDRLNRGPLNQDQSQLLFQSICVDSEMRFPSLPLIHRPLYPPSHSSSSSQSAGCDARCGVACECESRIPSIWEENGKTRKKQQLPFRMERGGRFIQRDRGCQSSLAPALTPTNLVSA